MSKKQTYKVEYVYINTGIKDSIYVKATKLSKAFRQACTIICGEIRIIDIKQLKKE